MSSAYTETELENRTVVELKDILKILGLGISGTKYALINRILNHQKSDKSMSKTSPRKTIGTKTSPRKTISTKTSTKAKSSTTSSTIELEDIGKTTITYDKDENSIIL